MNGLDVRLIQIWERYALGQDPLLALILSQRSDTNQEGKPGVPITVELMQS
ncbi:hypothetical protein IT6_03175 [Methylacidiphilum caldifontis]|uniref:hypothetical protein n=1 Tax=Methylacidiphilum caldifontis TaxID=2795386 RepID=UPI001A8F79A5|nr:hypothetical protein [Methylacidiphilum caldifontis]QSR89299.1 hypothetical protein IT6_03175 [Methylacidiphilum caldifontis]